MNGFIQGLGWTAAIAISVMSIAYLLDRMGIFYQRRRRQLRFEIRELERKRDALQITVAISTDKE